MKNLKKALATSLAILNILPAVNGAEREEFTSQEETYVQESKKEDKQDTEFGIGDAIVAGLYAAAAGVAVYRLFNHVNDNLFDENYVIPKGSTRSLPTFYDCGRTRELVYKLYSFENIRNIVSNGLTDKSSKYIDALKYLFEVIDGTKEYNPDLIKNSYNVLRDGKRKFYESDYEDLAFIEKMYLTTEKDKLKFVFEESSKNDSLAQVLSSKCLQRDIAELTVVRDKTDSLKPGFALKDFEELNSNGNTYELRYVRTLFGHISTTYLKHRDGNWYKYENLLSKKVSEQEVMDSASKLGVNFVYNKKA